MSFFDEGDEPRTAIRSPKPPPRRPPARARRGPTDDRTLLIRRAGAAAIVIVVLIIIVLAVRAILNHQAIAGLKNYNAEVTTIVNDEQSIVRGPFFMELDGALGSSNPSEVPTTLQQYVNLEDGYYHQAEDWSVPAQMVGAQTYFVEALGLRYEALQGIETQLPTAIGNGSQQTHAIKLIAGEMEKLLASDVMYADRVAPLIEQALTRAGISGQTTPASQFLPDVGWLAPNNVAQRILGFVPTSLGGAPTSGTPGHELLGVSVQASDGTTTALASGVINKIPYTSAGTTFVLNVLNSGTITEYAVTTEIHFKKLGLSTSCLTKTSQIRKTVPGYTYLSSIVITPATCASPSDFINVPLDMTAGVVPLPGETNKMNNFQTFLVEFTQ
ncbi:MAG: hypothetical protein ABSD82_07300 [Solirubrobacteraceae bacterium]